MRKIIHIDMDAFYASVEQRDNLELKGRPVIVGGPPDSRGVVAACSYEARKYGIHSAMVSSRAFRLCPQAVFLRPRFEAYIAVSCQIREIFHEYTDLVEPLSLDEAYLDVTENKAGTSSATLIAEEIRRRIFKETELTASAGVSYNKFLAKVASDYNKPDGIMVIKPEMADEFIAGLPIGKFYGIGKVTEKRMVELGIKTGADLRERTRDELAGHFGKAGVYYYEIARGIDERPVVVSRIRKSLGKEQTFEQDLEDKAEMLERLAEIAARVEESLKKREIAGRTVTLKVKYFDFSRVTRSVTLDEPVCEAEAIIKHIRRLLDDTEAGKKRIRLLGISLSGLSGSAGDAVFPIQLRLPF